ncbi:MAG: hypothetical protein ACM3Q2_01310 [Syntrophothermus sp.]
MRILIIMIIPKLIIYLSTFIWVFPPLKQFRGRFFYYFLILGIADPAAMAMHYLKIDLALHLYVISSAGMLLCLPRTNKYLRPSYWIPIIILLFILVCILPVMDLMIIIGIIHILILFALLKYAVNYIFINGKVQLFHLLLITYETSIMLKFINTIFAWGTGKIEFFFITGFQILLGIMFCFIKEESPRLALKFR